jgi:hypothetical protein
VEPRPYTGRRLVRANQKSGAIVAAIGRTASEVASAMGMDRDYEMLSAGASFHLSISDPPRG